MFTSKIWLFRYVESFIHATYLRRLIFKWLFNFGTYFGVFKFYLWDLLPAVYLSHPELFTEQKGFIKSSLMDFEKGKLLFSMENSGNIKYAEANQGCG